MRSDGKRKKIRRIKFNCSNYEMKEDRSYKTISSREIYKNNWMRVREDKVFRPDGKDGIFGIVEMKKGVSVAAIDDRSNVFLVKEYKYAMGKEITGLISGGIEEGESPLQAAKRELKEEGGLEAEDWVGLGIFNPLTTAVYSPMYLFLAQKLRKVSSRSEEGEFIKIVKIPFKKSVEMVMESEITHGGSCVCILKVDKYLNQKK